MLLAILSDIHANRAALEAVLAAAGPVDGIRVLGDIVGYGPDPDAVVELLANRGATGVRGNHDLAALDGEGVDWFNPDARAAIEWTRHTIGETTRSWLAALPERLVDGPFTLVHGSPRDPTWEYIVDAGIAGENLVHLATRHCLFGHTHIPLAFLRHEDGMRELPAASSPLTLDERTAFVNPGSVGQPRDGIRAASWLLLDTAGPTVTWRRTPYDIAATQAAMRSAGLPPRLIARLDRGA
ncbi:MAG: metallophosphoesterase family protein [Chloroflexi bacterium]|nr:metallophosphoesterase family protein [Chloroflexota bacterium]